MSTLIDPASLIDPEDLKEIGVDPDTFERIEPGTSSEEEEKPKVDETPEDDEDEETPKPDEKSEEETPEDDPKPEDPKPEDQKPADPKPEDEERKTRKERREERQRAFFEEKRRQADELETQRRQPPQQNQPKPDDYKPIDYSKLEDIEDEKLEEDRKKYGETAYQRGQQTERFFAEQNKFWTDQEYKSKLLQYDPKYQFLDENNADHFDPDLAERVNELYLEHVGYNEQNHTVRRTDVPYDDFVKKYVADLDKYAEARVEEQAEEKAKNLIDQKSKGGIRPGGTRKSGLGQLKPGDVAKMSPDEFAKHEAEIDRQLSSLF